MGTNDVHHTLAVSQLSAAVHKNSSATSVKNMTAAAKSISSVSGLVLGLFNQFEKLKKGNQTQPHVCFQEPLLFC